MNQNKYIKLPTSGLISLHFFADNMMFPVVVAAYDDNQQEYIKCLSANIANNPISTGEFCRWCENHHMRYQIMYPLTRRQVFMNPYRYFIYKKLTHELKFNQYRLG